MLLREARRQDHHLRQVRPHYPDLRSVRSRGREHALHALFVVRHFRSNRLGFVDDGVGLSVGRDPIVRRNFEKFVLLVIFLSLVPVFTHALRAKLERKPSYNRETSCSRAARTTGSLCAPTSSPFATPNP